MAAIAGQQETHAIEVEFAPLKLGDLGSAGVEGSPTLPSIGLRIAERGKNHGAQKVDNDLQAWPRFRQRLCPDWAGSRCGP